MLHIVIIVFNILPEPTEININTSTVTANQGNIDRVPDRMFDFPIKNKSIIQFITSTCWNYNQAMSNSRADLTSLEC